MSRAFPLVALVLVLPLSGCFFSREISTTSRQIDRAHPDIRLEREFVLNLGPLSVRTARWLGSFAPETEHVDMALRYLDDIQRIKVGVYKTRRLDGRAGPAFDPTYGFEKGWDVAVKLREPDGNVWVLYRETGQSLRDLYVVVQSEEELVLARVRGRLDRLVAEIMEDHGDFGRLVKDSIETAGL